jgi:hypothetical protein
MKQVQNNWEVLAWTKKIKIKKAISLQQNPAVPMSSTVAVVLSEHTAVTVRTCPVADSKVAADQTSSCDRCKKRPDLFSGLFISEILSATKPMNSHENKNNVSCFFVGLVAIIILRKYKIYADFR